MTKTEFYKWLEKFEYRYCADLSISGKPDEQHPKNVIIPESWHIPYGLYYITGFFIKVKHHYIYEDKYYFGGKRTGDDWSVFKPDWTEKDFDRFMIKRGFRYKKEIMDKLEEKIHQDYLKKQTGGGLERYEPKEEKNMKVKIEIELEDLMALYNGYKANRFNNSYSTQDYDVQVKEKEQEEHIDKWIKPIFKELL